VRVDGEQLPFFVLLMCSGNPAPPPPTTTTPQPFDLDVLIVVSNVVLRSRKDRGIFVVRKNRKSTAPTPPPPHPPRIIVHVHKLVQGGI